MAIVNHESAFGSGMMASALFPKGLIDQRSTINDGPWTMVDGRWTMVDGRWTMDDGPWTMDDGPWTIDGTRLTTLVHLLLVEILVICIVAFLASGLTLFSGFGLGTLLMPVFALFFPIEIAIAMTAVVHLLNNLFKLAIFRKHIDRMVLIRFGIASVLAALLGAWLLHSLREGTVLFSYSIGERVFQVTLIRLVIGLLMIFFALFELLPYFNRLSFHTRWLPLGGVLSGFFGGLSGHQGALRSAFLIRIGLSKEAFIASGVAVACMVDISRLTVYYSGFAEQLPALNYTWLMAATLSAFAGAYLGNRLLKKITIRLLQVFVAIMILLFAILIIMGIV